MSTLQEIKAAVATLPATDRSELATWLGESEDVSKIRREQLMREVRMGLDQIQQGDFAPLDMAAIKRKARNDWDARQHS
jgi:hypothetical protein